MQSKTIAAALQAATDTKGFLIREGCRFDAPQMFQEYFAGKTAMIVADDNTFAAAGRDVQQALNAAQIPTLPPFIFPGAPTLHAEYRHVDALREALQPRASVIPIAVGSGTINDLVKRTVFELGRRYMVVATAASVDGYSSFGAPIVQSGFKKTMECPAPLAILADIAVLRGAPAAMTAAGYADLMSKITGGADWIIADAVGVTPILPPIWEMIQPHLRQWLAQPETLAAGDSEAFSRLFEGLSMTGFAMQAMQDSRPASGSEHLFSHVWDMQNHRDADGNSVSHGFQVGLGTLASAALMETVFRRDIHAIDIDSRCRQWNTWKERAAEIRQTCREMPGIERILAESQAKHVSREQLRERLQRVAANWDALRDKVAAQLFPYQELKRRLRVMRCPVAPHDINLTPERVKQTYFLAQTIRSRYTILDFAYELGWLGECAEEIITSAPYFA